MAIAFDNFTDLGSTTGTSLIVPHTLSGSNTLLIVGILADVTSDLVSASKWNGGAMNFLDKYHLFGGADRWAYVYYLFGAATGTKNVEIDTSSSSFIAAFAVSYNGVAQSGFDGTLRSVNDGSSVASLNNAITSSADNCWHIGVSMDASGIVGAGTGTTQRGVISGGNMQMLDNNSVIHPGGSNTIQMTSTGGSQAGLALFGMTIAPFVASTTPPAIGYSVPNTSFKLDPKVIAY